MIGKSKIVGRLGESGLLLPELVNAALAANDRAKYRMTLLQAACTAADRPDEPTPDLHAERLAAGVQDASLDELTALARRGTDPGLYIVSGASKLLLDLVEDVRAMAQPLVEANRPDAPGTGAGQRLADRLEALIGDLPDWSSDELRVSDLGRITSASAAHGDSLHRLVMDLHKELNQLQSWLSNESIEGARVYGLDDPDRPLVAAFMQGVNRTSPLRFDHPGLTATATRTGEKLVIRTTSERPMHTCSSFTSKGRGSR